MCLVILVWYRFGLRSPPPINPPAYCAISIQVYMKQLFRRVFQASRLYDYKLGVRLGPECLEHEVRPLPAAVHYRPSVIKS